KAELPGALLRHDEHGRGAVVERARVAGRDRAVGLEGRLELGELLHRRAGARTVVARDLRAVDLHGDDLAVEMASVARGDGPVLGDPRPLVRRPPAALAALC